jgi:hypothetical protein
MILDSERCNFAICAAEGKSPERSKSSSYSSTKVHHNGPFSSNGARPPPVLHTCKTSREVARPDIVSRPRLRKITIIRTNPYHRYILILLTVPSILLTPSDPRIFANAELVLSSPDIKRTQYLTIKPSSQCNLDRGYLPISWCLLAEEILVILRKSCSSLDTGFRHTGLSMQNVSGFLGRKLCRGRPGRNGKIWRPKWTKQFPGRCVEGFIEAKIVQWQTKWRQPGR